MTDPASPFPDLPDLARCMICKRPHAAYGMGWPGLPQSQPDRVRGKIVRLCALDGECHAQAILLATKAAGVRFPWPANASASLRARVADLTAEQAPPAPAKPSSDQPALL
ncbi:MAG: hypothetical protein AAGE03_04495 [Pseudomonadota bacterium]